MVRRSLHPSPLFSHLTLIMPRPAGGAKKRPVAKTLALKEAAAKEAMVKPSARKATSGTGMHVTRGKENRPVTAASVSSMSATSVRRTHAGAQPAVPALSRGMPTYYHRTTTCR